MHIVILFYVFACEYNCTYFPKQLGAVGVLAVLIEGRWLSAATAEPSACSKLLYLIGQTRCRLQKHIVKLMFLA